MHWLTPRGQGTWEKETTVSPTENFCATFLFLLRIVAVSRFFSTNVLKGPKKNEMMKKLTFKLTFT